SPDATIRNCCAVQSAVGWPVTFQCRIRRVPTSKTTKTTTAFTASWGVASDTPILTAIGEFDPARQVQGLWGGRFVDIFSVRVSIRFGVFRHQDRTSRRWRG